MSDLIDSHQFHALAHARLKIHCHLGGVGRCVVSAAEIVCHTASQQKPHNIHRQCRPIQTLLSLSLSLSLSFSNTHTHTNSLIHHSLTRSLTHIIHSLTHSLTHSLIHSPTHVHTQAKRPRPRDARAHTRPSTRVPPWAPVLILMSPTSFERGVIRSFTRLELVVSVASALTKSRSDMMPVISPVAGSLQISTPIERGHAAEGEAALA